MSQDPQYSETPQGQQYQPQAYQPQPYGQQAYPAQAYGYPVPPTNTMAVLALVFAFVFWPLAIVFGHVAHKQIARTGEGGRGLATAGLVIGYIFLGITLLAIVAFVVAIAGAASLNT